MDGEQRASRADAHDKPPAVVCTLGMHRSGTSVASRLINLLGVYLGAEEDVSYAGQDNPRGYWEHRTITALNDEILARFGGRWDQPPVLPAGWPRDPRLTLVTEQASALIAQQFAATPTWGWKDPRTCLTLPFWQQVVGPMDYVVCLRDPVSVAASLEARNGMTAAHAERLWLAYVQASLTHTSGGRRLLVFYEDVLADWRSELGRMASFLGSPARADDPRVTSDVATFVDRELCHHRASPGALAADQGVSFFAKGLYLALRAYAPRALMRSGATEAHTRHLTGDDAMLDSLATQALEAWDARANAARECNRLEQERQRIDARRLDLEAERNRLRVEVRTLASRATALSATVQEVHESTAWQIMTLWRRGVERALPAATRRRRAYAAVARRAGARLSRRRQRM